MKKEKFYEYEDDYEVPEPDIPEDVPSVHVCRISENSWYVWAMQYLLKLYDATVQADGNFGQLTARAIMKFQKEAGLDETAECDYYTWNCLWNDNRVRIDDRGHDVRAIQYLLRAQDYMIEPDGEFGVQTFNQLVRYQKACGLIPTGICDLETFNYLILG